MFRDRINSGPFFIRDMTGDSNCSFTPQEGDVATVVVDENDIQVQVKLENQTNKSWNGKIVSYHPIIEGKTPDERLEEIKKHEEFVNDHHLTNGSEISFAEGKIFCLSR